MSQELNLTQKRCQPCEGMGQAMTKEEVTSYLSKVPSWELSSNEKEISKQFIVKNFMTGINFINEVATLAEAENHHPDLHLTGYRNLKITLSTHALNGLSMNDFILAAKINELPVELKK